MITAPHNHVTRDIKPLGQCPGCDRVPRFRIDETIKYDRELGEVHVLVEGVVRESMRVRTALAEGVLLEAIVAELERRGYTVTPPT